MLVNFKSLKWGSSSQPVVHEPLGDSQNLPGRLQKNISNGIFFFGLHNLLDKTISNLVSFATA
jgi:hypothetical protein